MVVLCKLWNDDAGVVLSSELVLILTILVIGMIAGLSALQISVVQELGDVAAAFGAISQSYSYGGVTSCCATTDGSFFDDLGDQCDVADTNSGSGGNAVDPCQVVAGISAGNN